MLDITHQQIFRLLIITILSSPSLAQATFYNVSGNFWGVDGAEIYGTMEINNSFSTSTIETAWEAYQATPTPIDFFLKLDYQITSFDLYRTDNNDSFFFGKDGHIEVIVTDKGGTMPNATWYSAWSLRGTGTAFSAYSGRYGDDVFFSNNGTNLTDYEYDQLAQSIQLRSGIYNDDTWTMVSLTLTEATPIPEPNTFLLLSAGFSILTLLRYQRTDVSGRSAHQLEGGHGPPYRY